MFSLTVTDEKPLSSAPDSVTLTVKARPAPPPPRRYPPVAAAGEDQTVAMGQTLRLDGSRSRDPDGSIRYLRYNWTQTSGTTVTLTSARSSIATFRAPSNAAASTLVTDFRLTVTDWDGLSDSDSTKVRAVNQPPTVHPVSQTVFTGTSVALNAGAEDPEGGTLTYAWSRTAGARVSLSSTTVSNPTFKAPSNGTTLTYSVVVEDGVFQTAAAALTVKVLKLACDAGANQTVNMGDAAVLRGNCEKDAGVGRLRYAWSQTSGATVSLRGADQTMATFTAPTDANKKTETLEFEFKGDVSTPQSHERKDRTTVTAKNQPPTVDPIPNQTMGVGKTVTLDGSKSSDPEGGELEYVWTQTGGTTVSLGNEDKGEPNRTFTAPASAAVLNFRLTVKDGATLTRSRTTKVTVTNRRPVVPPMPAQTVWIGEAVTLDGSGAYDPDGQTLTYAWSQPSGTTVSLSSEEAAQPTFTAPSSAGALGFRLAVSDPGGLSASGATAVRVQSYTLSVSPTPTNGKVTGGGINCGEGTTGTPRCSLEVAPGANLTLMAMPTSSSYEHREWTGDCADSTGGTCILSDIQANKTLSADFDQGATPTTQYIYHEAPKAPAALTGGTGTLNHLPTGWQRNKPDPCSATSTSPSAHQRVYRAQRTQTLWKKDNALKSATAWSTPVELLTVDAKGPYRSRTISGGSFPSLYAVSVNAQAYGGNSPYEYQWQRNGIVTPISGWHTSGSATYRYFASFVRPPTSRDVTVIAREKNTPTTTACHKARINFGAVGGAGGEAAGALAVQVGGELLLIWGGEGSFTASSEDSTISSLSVDAAAILVRGVAAGSTAIIVRTDSEKGRIPIAVGG